MMRILVVEDDMSLLVALADRLTHEGFDVDIAVNGLDALNKMEKKVYEIVILDIIMPLLDGVGVLKEMQTRGIESKVIVLSNLGEMTIRKELDFKNVVGVYTKSDMSLDYTVEVLKEAINNDELKYHI